jgi:N-acetylmuramoyl-L-alanine amidase/Putative peptidoglycan binding domain
MENVNLELEPGEFLSEFDEIEDDEATDDEFDLINDGPLFEDELPDDEEIRRFRPNVSRRPIRSRSRFASRLNGRRPLRARFPGRTRPHPPRLPWMGRPGFRRRAIARHPVLCTCPTPGTEYARWVQSSLNQVMGLNLAVNGVMNADTRSALRQFQQQRGLPVDGIAGPETKTALMAARSEKTIPTSAPPPHGSDSAELDFMPGEEGEEFIDSLWPFPPRFRIEDRTHLTPKDKRKKTRPEADVYALVLHQTAFSRGNDPTRYDTVTAHYVILPNGQILQLHPISAYLWASNGFNARSVAVEFVGNFPSIRGRCWKPQSYGCHTLSQEQIGAGRYLVEHLIRTIGLTHILAHRQSSGTRENDPGPDIWCQVGEWAINTHGLRDGGTGFKIGTGKSIPDTWRNWCDAGTNPRELQELVRDDLESEPDEDSDPEASHGHEASSLQREEEQHQSHINANDRVYDEAFELNPYEMETDEFDAASEFNEQDQSILELEPLEIDLKLENATLFDEDSDAESLEAWKIKLPRRKRSRRKSRPLPLTKLCFWVAGRLTHLKEALEGLNKALKGGSRDDIKVWLTEVKEMIDPIFSTLKTRTFSSDCTKRDLQAFAAWVKKLRWPKSEKRNRARLIAAIQRAASKVN